MREIVQETAVTQESDPTVPNWAKEQTKPTYTYEEITEKPDLVEDIGSSLAEETNVLTIELKDKNGKVIASTKVTIPKGETPDLSAYVKTEDRDEFVKGGITENSLPLTGEEKASACEWLGAVKQQNPTTKNTVWVYIAQVYADGEVGQVTRRASASKLADAIPIYGAGGALQVGEPPNGLQSYHATPRDWVENMPDKVTLTDDQKAKWRAMLGVE